MPQPENESQIITIGELECTIHLGADGTEGGIEETPDGENGFEARVTFKCDWADRWYLVQKLLGTVDYANGEITRTEPYPYPILNPTQTYNELEFDATLRVGQLFCTSIGTIKGIKWRTDIDGSETGAEGWGTYQYALVPAVFTTPPYLINDDQSGEPFEDPSGLAYCVTEEKTSGEVFAPPTGAVVWLSGSFVNKKLTDIGSQKLRVRKELTVTRVRMPIIPDVTVDNLVGTINSMRVNIGTDGYAPGTMIFLGMDYDTRPEPTNFGLVYDVHLQWLVNVPGENTGSGGPIAAGNALRWDYYLDPSGQWNQVGYNQDPPTGLFLERDHNFLLSNTIS